MRSETVESAIAVMMSVMMVLATTGTGMGEEASGPAPVIGTVVAKGAFRMDNATVIGNATLFEGATIETKSVESHLELSSGARILLGSDSKARFYGDHMILEKGGGELQKASGFRFEARGLIIQPETGIASARVALGSGARIELAALSGSFRVLNAHGMLVANVGAGRALELEPQASDATTKLTGTLTKVGGHFLLTDETTNVTVELSGQGLAKEVGNRVEITGSMDPAATPVTDASQFIRVTTLKHLGKGATGTSNTAPAARGGAAGGHGLAMSTSTIAIIGGVAAAATLGGLAAAGKLPGQGSSISR